MRSSACPCVCVLAATPDPRAANECLEADVMARVMCWLQVKIEEPIMRIPMLAIHLNRDIGTEGFKPNKQTHCVPVLATAIKKSIGDPAGEIRVGALPYRALLQRAVPCHGRHQARDRCSTASPALVVALLGASAGGSASCYTVSGCRLPAFLGKRRCVHFLHQMPAEIKAFMCACWPALG